MAVEDSPQIVVRRAAKVALAISIADPARRLRVQVAASRVADLVLAVPVRPAGHGPDPGVGAVGIDGQQQALRQHAFREVAAVGNRRDRAQAAGAQHRLLEDVDQGNHAPEGLDLVLSLRRLRGSATGGNGASLTGPWRRSAISNQLHSGSAACRASNSPRICSRSSSMNSARIERFAQRPVVLNTAFLEVDRQILGRVAPLLRAYHRHPISLHRN
jgi:hypothetical protein